MRPAQGHTLGYHQVQCDPELSSRAARARRRLPTTSFDLGDLVYLSAIDEFVAAARPQARVRQWIPGRRSTNTTSSSPSGVRSAHSARCSAAESLADRTAYRVRDATAGSRGALGAAHHGVLMERRHEGAVFGEHRSRSADPPVTGEGRFLREQEPLTHVGGVVEVRGVRDHPGRDRTVRLADVRHVAVRSHGELDDEPGLAPSHDRLVDGNGVEPGRHAEPEVPRRRAIGRQRDRGDRLPAPRCRGRARAARSGWSRRAREGRAWSPRDGSDRARSR